MNDEQWQAAWRIFESACGLPVERRRAYVESACPPEIASEVFAMLENFERAGSQDEAPDLSSQPDPEEWPRVGTTVGRYTITGTLGRGGMGEVYSAEDTELHRQVALKFLSPGRVGTSGTVDRLIREARAASALNHPNVVTVYEVIRSGPSVAIAMELVEGEALRTRCGMRQPVDSVALSGRQIAAALAAAHARGIVHRDIKPENVMLRSDGYVKVLDFGLAREAAGATQDSITGLPPGTLRYMSPEQALGDPATSKSDVFSLGIVLYELAAGAHPFEARSALAVAHALMTQAAAPPSKMNPAIPAAFDSLILSMLEKHPGKRPDAATVALRLSEPWAMAAPGSEPLMRRHQPVLRAAVAVVAVAGVVAAGWLWQSGRRSRPDVASRTPQTVPFTSYEGSETEPSFSPDGQQIAFAWTGENGLDRDIYVKAIGSDKLRRLTSDPAEEFSPAWSPDGQQIAFLRRPPGTSQPFVMVVPAAGGQARQAGQIINPEGYPGSIGWWPDSKSLVVRDDAPGGIALVRLYLDTGEKRPLTYPPQLTSDGLPVLSPGGRRIAFTRREIRGGSVCTLDLGTLQSHCVHRVEAEGESINGTIGGIAWQADGKGLLYCDKTAIWRLILNGDRAASVSRVMAGSFPFLTGDRQGQRLAFSQTYSDSNIWRASLDPRRADGRQPEKLAPSSEAESEPQYSADGNIVFRSRRTGTYEIFICDREGGHLRQVTSFGGHLGSPGWSPDGKWIAFDGYGSASDKDTKFTNIYVVSSSGGPVRRVTPDLGESQVPAWSRDGKWIYYILADGNRQETWKISPEGGATVRVAAFGHVRHHRVARRAVALLHESRGRTRDLAPGGGRR